MPARRSRTEHWRETLEQLHERNGAIELTIPGASDAPAGEDALASNLIWRVRVLALTDSEILVEHPVVLRQRVDLNPGIELVGVIVSGPNRWMFSTRHLGNAVALLAGGRESPAIRLSMPERVERCQRRSFYRISTVGLTLPRVSCHPLLDPASAAIAEAANRTELADAERSDQSGVIARIETGGIVLPDVGPEFPGVLMNLGGGGAGLLIDPEHARTLERHRHLWMRLHLTPHVAVPLGIAGRVVHTHIDAQHRVYAGISFDFSGDRTHERFVITQLCKFVAEVQRDQLRRQTAAS
ncbi:MAG: hypothetical protein AB7G17_01365 [Phycisphaerales bacterium]